MNVKLKDLLTILFVASSVYCFGLVFIPKGLISLFTTTSTITYFALLFKQRINGKIFLFTNILTIFLAAIFANAISSYYNNGSSIPNTLFAYFSFFQIGLYFYLHEYDVKVDFLERIIFWFALCYGVIYIIQLIVFPFAIIEYASKILTEASVTGAEVYDRGTLRLRGPGGGFLMLAYFMSLNKALVSREYKHALFSGFFLLVLFLGGFRTLVAVSFLLSAIMILKMFKPDPKSIFAAFLILVTCGVTLSLPIVQNILSQMIYATEEQKGSASENIRLLEFEYYMTEFPKNATSYIFGTGMPNGLDSDKYSEEIKKLNKIYGLFWEDLGLFGLYIIAGIGVAGSMVAFSIKSAFIKLPSTHVYPKFFLLYLLFGSLLSMEMYRRGIFGIEAIALYLTDKCQRTA